ncbi:hypothetical protein [Helicobacter sp. MIT 14-3879]|uniref:hypothetical protein n=1 Tax=Helicobacter sp. MIT 14-3879 TaxID=2040649 RepID=UPI000E1F8279|nr:hypothetical protein [Helicobacter sp. MIT 14-3879]RDU65220.1 hypothetical protein CQA44_02590 [Helicobacter sp. MIT 14-3879]
MSSFQTQIYEQLDKLDDYLVDKNPSERVAFGLLIGIVIAAVLYFAFYDLSSGYKFSYEGIYNDINSKLQQETEYIDSMDNGGFISLEQQINSSQKDISQAQENLKYLQGLINEVFVYSKDWFLTFDDASKAAASMGLIVNGTDIEMNDATSLGGMKYSSFVLFGYGKFSQILQYIDWLETYGKFISLDSIIIESKNNRLNFSILIRNFRGGI